MLFGDPWVNYSAPGKIAVCLPHVFLLTVPSYDGPFQRNHAAAERAERSEASEAADFYDASFQRCRAEHDLCKGSS